MQESLYRVGQAPAGNQREAQMLAEHLHLHEPTARAAFEELAEHRGFRTTVLDRWRQINGQRSP